MVRSRHAATQSRSNISFTEKDGLTNGSLMRYGRGMPRPKAEVNSLSRKKMGLLMGRGMPRPYNLCATKTAVIFFRGKRLAYQRVAACRDRTTSALPKQQQPSFAEKDWLTNGSRHAATIQPLRYPSNIRNHPPAWIGQRTVTSQTTSNPV